MSATFSLIFCLKKWFFALIGVDLMVYFGFVCIFACEYACLLANAENFVL